MGNSFHCVDELKKGKRCVIVCAGDSITEQNYHLNGFLNYVGILGAQLSAYRKARIINAGVSGETADNFLSRWEEDVAGFSPNLLTVMFGINDSVKGSGNIPVFRRNLRAIIEKSMDIGAELLFITQNPMIEITIGKLNMRDIKKTLENGTYTSGSFSGTCFDEVLSRIDYPQYVQCLRDTASEFKIPLCDIYAEWEKHLLDNARDKWLLMSDLMHPNEYGHQFIARVLLQFLQV